MHLPENRWGRVVGGKRDGWFIKLVDDTDGTGGWYVFEAPVMDVGRAYDNWFEAREYAEEHLARRAIDWTVEQPPA